MEATDPSYPPVGRCIYCGSASYSAERARLGDEHVIPEALNGRIVLREASCQDCERAVNWFEHYCMTKTLGPLRYWLGMRTKRPKSRPTTLPIKLLVNGEWTAKDVPVEWAPVSLFMPVFDPPEILQGNEPTRNTVYTNDFWHRALANGDARKIGEAFGATKGETYQVTLDGTRFALQLAKIAHGYAFAERSGLDAFNPILPDTILRKPWAVPLPYLIGGLREISPPVPCLTQLDLRRGETQYGVTWLVDIRLFGPIGAPTYRVVVSVERPPQIITSRTTNS